MYALSLTCRLQWQHKLHREAANGAANAVSIAMRTDPDLFAMINNEGQLHITWYLKNLLVESPKNKSWRFLEVRFQGQHVRKPCSTWQRLNARKPVALECVKSSMRNGDFFTGHSSTGKFPTPGGLTSLMLTMTKKLE